MACFAKPAPPSLAAPIDPAHGLLIAVQGFDARASARGPRGGGSLIVVGQFPEVTEGQEMHFTGEVGAPQQVWAAAQGHPMGADQAGL